MLGMGAASRRVGSPLVRNGESQFKDTGQHAYRCR
jgi:hypothetical protein